MEESRQHRAAARLSLAPSIPRPGFTRLARAAARLCLGSPQYSDSRWRGRKQMEKSDLGWREAIAHRRSDLGWREALACEGEQLQVERTGHRWRISGVELHLPQWPGRGKASQSLASPALRPGFKFTRLTRAAIRLYSTREFSGPAQPGFRVTRLARAAHRLRSPPPGRGSCLA